MRDIMNKEILTLLMDMGCHLADNNFTWSNDLRSRFEDATTYLSSY